jgi:hypothetical protein
VEGERHIQLVLELDERVEHHGAADRDVHRRGVGARSVDREGLFLGTMEKVLVLASLDEGGGGARERERSGSWRRQGGRRGPTRGGRTSPAAPILGDGSGRTLDRGGARQSRGGRVLVGVCSMKRTT